MRLTKQQYNIAIGGAKENAQTIARCSHMDEEQTRTLMMRAIIARQLELLSSLALTVEGHTSFGLSEFEAMARRLEDLIFDHSK